MISPTLAPVTGVRMDPEFFRIDELSEFDPDRVIDVLRGKQLGVIFRGAIPPAVCEDMTARFWNSTALTRRTGEPSYHVGSYHWNKPIDTYLAETSKVVDDVMDLLDVDDSPWHWYRARMNARLQRGGAHLRLAEMDGEKACPALVRAWNNDGEFALEPHEDEAQCRDPRQAGFEVQRVLGYEVCATNMCIEQEGGGRLVLWNVRPDDTSRRRFGIEYSGFSYPPETMNGHERLAVDIRLGDIYVFNGRHVHAVEPTLGNRTAVSFLLGFIDEQTVVSWT